MTTINLKDISYWYTQDQLIEVSDEVAEVFKADARYEMAYQRRLSRHKAQYSLNCDDGIEYSACLHPLTYFLQEASGMAYRVKAYTLREESTESGTRYFISFKDGQGKSHELEVSEQFFMEFRQMERRNRNLLQWDERHREFSEVWDETLNRRALKLPKSIEEQMIEAERAELLCKAVDGLPEIQRRRFLLYYEYEFNFYQIAAMEHCTASAIQKSVAIAKEKVKAEMRKYLQP